MRVSGLVSRRALGVTAWPTETPRAGAPIARASLPVLVGSDVRSRGPCTKEEDAQPTAQAGR